MPQLQTDEVLPIETPYLLSLSRLVAYKQVALSIGAALRTGSTLLIAGEGEEKHRLVSLAGTHAYIRKEELLATFLRKYSSIPGAILFLGTVTDTERLHLLKQAEALLMPGIEDFGITALEAAYLGTPSILHKDSGVSEVLLAGTHAVHLESESVEALVTAVTSFKKQKFSAEALKKQAETCSTTLFTRKMIKHVYDSIIRTKKPSSNTT